MRGNRRERASLALMATAAYSLLLSTGLSYQKCTRIRYQSAAVTSGTEILKQGVEREFPLDTDVEVPHGRGGFRVPPRRRRLTDEPQPAASADAPTCRRPEWPDVATDGLRASGPALFPQFAVERGVLDPRALQVLTAEEALAGVPDTALTIRASINDDVTVGLAFKPWVRIHDVDYHGAIAVMKARPTVTSSLML